MNTEIYHFTTSAQLPWIMDSGELRPTTVKIGDFPNPDFIWATSDKRGDRTATSMYGEAYRNGATMQVRLTLVEEDFFRWQDVSSLHPEWQPKHIDALEVVAKRRGVDPANWWCRAETLSLDRVAAIHWRSYSNNNWAEFNGQGLREYREGNELWRVVTLGNKSFASHKGVGPQGQDAYTLSVWDDDI